MSIKISFDKHTIGPFVFRNAHKAWGPEGREAIGLVDGDRVLAGVVFEDYSGPGGSVCLHVAVAHPNVPLRKLITTCFMYAFNQLAVEKLIGLVPSTNKEALTFDVKLGFKPEAVIEGAFPDGDLVVLTMNREQCRYLPKAKKAA